MKYPNRAGGRTAGAKHPYVIIKHAGRTKSTVRPSASVTSRRKGKWTRKSAGR